MCPNSKIPKLNKIYPNRIAIARNDVVAWSDRSFTFANLPSYLDGALLFQIPQIVTPKGAQIELILYQPSIIYVAHEQIRNGGFDKSLLNTGWTLVTDNATVLLKTEDKSEAKDTGCCAYKFIWKMDVSISGRTVINLPATTTMETVHSLFVQSFRK